jgi:hypothetical protein
MLFNSGIDCLFENTLFLSDLPETNNDKIHINVHSIFLLNIDCFYYESETKDRVIYSPESLCNWGIYTQIQKTSIKKWWHK